MNPTRSLPRWLCLTAAALAFAAPAAAQKPEKLPANAKVIKLEARPAALDLKHPYDYAQLQITARLDNGDTIDATRIAKLDPPAKLVKVSPTGLVRPAADGKGELKAVVGGQTLSVPVAVAGQKQPYQVSFVRDVMPVLSKLGCNAGTCHGSAEGKNGFKLSLRGYDPLFDHRSLTDDLEGRRFNRAAPERSLMLMKPSGASPHAGGVVWQAGDPYYELVKAWIADGVKLDLNSPRVVSLEVLPKAPTIPLPGMRQQMAVLAKYGDGSVRDVTAEAFVESSNAEVATVDKAGLVTAVRRGEATMLARYEGAYSAATLIVMGDRSGFAWNDPPAYNYIDELVYEKLKRVKVLPSETCTDAEFVRRVYLDLTGLPPKPEEVRAFLDDVRPAKAKRDELVDRLVGSPDYVEHWTNKWADLLQVNRKFLGEPGAKALREYIRKAIAENRPYDKFANEILTASGSNVENPPASYYKVLRDPDAAMENTTQLFLAIRFNCNKCHDHPFERWTQDQYYSLTSFFAQVGRTEDPKFKGQKIGGTAVEGAQPLVEIIKDTGNGEVKHARTGQVARPQFPFTHPDLAPANAPRREQLAHWVTSKENPYFAKSYVNRMWSYLLGVGIIEPVDDIRAGNPPTNPALLDRLTKEFVASNFDVQKLVKTICKSRTYQLSIRTNQWNEGDDINYAHAIARRLPAEVLYDAIHRATGVQSRLPGLPQGARAAQLLDSNVELPSGFLDLFGKPARESACECERSSGLMLGPVLNLVNGPIVAEAIKDPNNRLAQLAAKYKDDRRFVEEIYLAVLARYPTPKETKLAIEAIHAAEPDYAALLAAYNRKLDALKAYEKQLDARQPAWEQSLKNAPTWSVLEVTKAESQGKAKLTKQPDGSVLVGGPKPVKDNYTVTLTTKLKDITAIRLEVLPDPSLAAKGPGRAPNGNFVLNELVVKAAPSDKPNQAKPVPLHKAVATFSQDQYAVGGAIDNNPATGWAVSPRFGQAQSALFEVKNVISNPNGTTFTVTFRQQFGQQHTIGKFRLSATSDKQPRLADGLPENLAKVLAVPPEKRSPQDKAELARLFRSRDAEYNRLAQAAGNPPPADKRVLGAQDLTWALINNPAFLFNH